MAVPSTPVVTPSAHQASNPYTGPLTPTATSAGSTSLVYEATTDNTEPANPSTSSATYPAEGIAVNFTGVYKFKVAGKNADGVGGYAYKSYYLTAGASRTLADALQDAEDSVAAADAALADAQGFLDEAQTLA